MKVLSEGRCAAYRRPQGPAGVDIEERPRTAPEPGMVAVEIRVAGLNHLDLWTAQGAQRIEPPRVLCADGAGVVADSADPDWRPGDEVIIYPVASCGRCPACTSGQQVLCAEFGVIGEHTDGTACERLHVPGRLLRRRPAGLDWAQAAALPLTYLTAWRMLVTRARLRAGETVLVVGAGAGVAVAAVDIARHLGARVLVTSRSERKRGLSLERGADLAFDSTGFATDVRAATGGGVDVVFEHVGPATLDQSMRSLRPGGRLVTCGSTSGTRAEINMPRLFFGQFDLLGSTMGTAPEFDALLAAVASGGLVPVVDRVFPLDEVRAALEHLERAEQFGKVALQVTR